jgi:hypothetical protein
MSILRSAAKAEPRLLPAVRSEVLERFPHSLRLGTVEIFHCVIVQYRGRRQGGSSSSDPGGLLRQCAELRSDRGHSQYLAMLPDSGVF